MEDAYVALYQEFLRLRSICQRQGALLQHLTEALNTRQGATHLDLHGGLDTPMSMPVQCLQSDLINFYSSTHQPVAYRQPPHQSTATNTACTGDGVMTDLLASGLDGLQLMHPQPQALLGGSEGCGPQGSMRPPAVFTPPKGPPSIIDDLKRAEQQWAETNAARERRPWASSSFLDSEWMSLSGGRVISRVAPQSQVCEFCQAVFPGHTTTRGEFLRHLTSHIT
ncbi:hypothetical protein ACEWY4_013292 [Coilia grayii]|uniref:Uncharacterized protein n=1 Tax=Coilia grayii TaxID=363190 RepID=A0ABD1JVX4_9TELE